ncbi:MAG: SO_0444 family Cu/Zn efflux transporter, partial [Alloprevotella sp.]|nr:SO_0444 family Cu/Zn efflux transporter [Alloprevotella sp.]
MESFLHLVCEMAPFLLLGFLLAGLMHAFIPGRFYSRYLSANRFRSVVNAALFGIPLPLCSCGVIPTAMSLRKEGASRGAVVSFLIATPQTGVDSIAATYGLMGLPFAITRPIVALLTALFGGTLVMAADRRAAAQESAASAPCAAKGRAAQGCGAPAPAATTLGGRLAEALRYGFVEMMQDIGRWLVLGLLIAAVITIAIPASWFTLFEGNTWASMPLVLAIAIPMYVCATGSIPIAVALMLKGLTPGAALVLLMAGPACNMASILVVRKVLGTRTMMVYLASIILGAVGFGVVVDALHYGGVVDFLGPISGADACCMADTPWYAIASGVVLMLLLANALILQRHHHHTQDADSQQSTASTSTTMKVYRIQGMNCNHCRLTAEKAILAVEGVTAATVNLQTQEARVEGTAPAEA